MLTVCSVTFAQDAASKIKELYDKYSAIPNYKVNVQYVAVNENMGFENTQNGVLVVEGNKYILKYGPNETWVSDGKISPAIGLWWVHGLLLLVIVAVYCHRWGYNRPRRRKNNLRPAIPRYE